MAQQAAISNTAPNPSKSKSRGSNSRKVSQTAVQKRAELDKVIKSILSPGTFFQNQSAKAFRLPTGERGKSFLQTFVWEETLVPDANGQIIVASLPFYEAPFARVTKSAAGGDDIVSATAIRPESVSKFKDWMKDNKIYAWRMNCQSMTVAFTGNLTNQSGSVVAATMQPAIDTKTVLTAEGILQNYARTIDRLPVTPQAIQSQARAFYTGNAVDGVYLVNRHVDANLPFTQRNSDVAKAYAGIWKGTAVAYQPNYAYFATDVNAGVLLKADAEGVPVTAPSCTDIGVAMFTGGNEQQSYRAKFVMSVEFIIKPGSPYASQCEPIPPRNFWFLQALSRASSKDNYGNADSNSWGSLFSGLKKAWDFISPVAEVVSEVLPPQYAAPLKTITSVSKKLQQAANKINQSASAMPEYTKPQMPQSAPIASGPRMPADSTTRPRRR